VKPITPEEDAQEIWGSAYGSGMAKYAKGQAEHGGGFWTAGASWYAAQLRDEALDAVAYQHHLLARLASIRSLARMMREDDGMTLSMAATILDHLAGDRPPNPHPRHHRHD
jgi:hypothetical protein